MARSSNGSSGWSLTNTSAHPFGAGESGSNGPWTFVCWFKANSTSQSQCYVFHKHTNSFAMIYEFVDNTVEMFSVGGDIRTGSGLVVADTNWHHLAWRKAASGSSSYDKFLDGTKTNISGTLNVTIGGGPDKVVTLFQAGADANRFNGQLAEVSVVLSALTDQNIADLAAGSVSLATLVGSGDAYWPLCGVASPEPDLGSNAWDLTVNNVVGVTGEPSGIASPCGGGATGNPWYCYAQQ